MSTIGYTGAFLVGLVLGLLGGGGSILSVPLFVYLFGIPASLATAYSLFLVAVTSAAGTMGHLRERRVNFGVGVYFLIPSMLGIFFSRRILLPSLPDEVMRLGGFHLGKDSFILLVFALVMGLAAYAMLQRKPRHANATELSRKPRLGRISIYGLGAGTLMGFVGAGGGFLIIPVLVGLGRMEMKEAIGTSLFIIAASSFFGFGGDVLSGLVIEWRILGVCSLVSVAGVLLGARWSTRLSGEILKRGFGWLVLSIAILMIAMEAVHG